MRQTAGKSLKQSKRLAKNKLNRPSAAMAEGHLMDSLNELPMLFFYAMSDKCNELYSIGIISHIICCTCHSILPYILLLGVSSPIYT